MLVARVFSRPSKSIFHRYRSPLVIVSSQNQHSSLFSSGFHSCCGSLNKYVTSQAFLLQNVTLNHSAPCQRVGISTCTSPKPTKKKTFRPVNLQGISKERHDVYTNSHRPKTRRDAQFSEQAEILCFGKAIFRRKKEESCSKFKPIVARSGNKRRDPKLSVFSKDLKCKSNLSVDDLMKLLQEMEELLKVKDKEIEELKAKILRGEMNLSALETGGTWKRAMVAIYIYIAAYSVNITFLVILVIGMLF